MYIVLPSSMLSMNIYILFEHTVFCICIWNCQKNSMFILRSMRDGIVLGFRRKGKKKHDWYFLVGGGGGDFFILYLYEFFVEFLNFYYLNTRIFLTNLNFRHGWGKNIYLHNYFKFWTIKRSTILSAHLIVNIVFL